MNLAGAELLLSDIARAELYFTKSIGHQSAPPLSAKINKRLGSMSQEERDASFLRRVSAVRLKGNESRVPIFQ